ncbi:MULTISPECIES: hypothetical protein [unclassified Mesorhizobium]|uniref:hypothetical protein n=1 Tax=unclassified Mesorhizobium TaxID=325217 RepID=UPI000FC9C144|nr:MULTISPECIES: hypothetical protein [unclassified Mesorhizobium]RUW01102.1 hypothetical protein EOA49_12355 [Mesorhizobium sp. M1A.F.Ca.IN.020.04.1.1]RUW09397.1 hypothetical protein EOA53_16735 [Mesorhizobium sp. M1A.F.Ca.IN.020.03.1.1]RWF75492.1 MAG: hypothetical protein EOQ34_01645 [Mesorhizobium sp.]RWG16720.1 MAG: hypothetical protein EOQ58_07315 [Mesorhizobium sp.]RWG33437.1 MAG: hypothetical protein EOQ61_08335 [Mesorhizobium sp.]
MNQVINRRTIFAAAPAGVAGLAATAATVPAHVRYGIPDVLDFDRINEKKFVETAADLVRVAMAHIHGGTWRAKVDHENQVVLVISEQQAKPTRSRGEEIKACIERLHDLLCEETGDFWGMFLYPETNIETPAGSRQLAIFPMRRYPEGLINYDRPNRGLHDPTGITGQRLHYGEPVDPVSRGANAVTG